MDFEHIPVLKDEVLEGLAIHPDGIYLDGTLGGAGHAAEIAERLTEGGRLIGIDQDDEAIEAAKKRLEPFSDRVTVIRDNFENAAERLEELGIERVDGILLDLGVSSHQFDTSERGFSYHADAPLDMRMDRRQELTAADIVNDFDEKEILHILRDYGEERYAASIARQIVKARAAGRIETTLQLNSAIEAGIPAKMRAGGHPARKTYQALRIACNRELDVLERCLDTMVELLASGGRFDVITFHSLEDRIVKNRFRTWENPCTCPPGFPECVCGKRPKGKVITRKPVAAGEEELKRNRRARSAKLRVFEKI